MAVGRRRIVFGALLLVLFVAALDQTIVSTALPTIVGELGGLEYLSWVVTAYLLASTVVGPIYGKLGDMYGRKRVLQAALVVFLAGSALCGLAGSMLELIVFRAVQGLGGGGLIVVSMAVVGDIVAPRERGRYQGLFGGVLGIAVASAKPMRSERIATKVSVVEGRDARTPRPKRSRAEGASSPHKDPRRSAVRGPGRRVVPWCSAVVPRSRIGAVAAHPGF